MRAVASKEATARFSSGFDGTKSGAVLPSRGAAAHHFAARPKNEKRGATVACRAPFQQLLAGIQAGRRWAASPSITVRLTAIRSLISSRPAITSLEKRSIQRASDMTPARS